MTLETQSKAINKNVLQYIVCEFLDCLGNDLSMKLFHISLTSINMIYAHKMRGFLRKGRGIQILENMPMIIIIKTK